MTESIVPRPSLNYRQAGVDIDAGHALVERIKPLAQSTARPEVIGGLGGFGALFDLSNRYRSPILVSGTDGVGTKLKLAQQFQRHHTIGIDLVAMCANDILVQGAEPLFFLDYYAQGQLELDTATAVIAGIAQGCQQIGCALIGGETAEMPGLYQQGDYDLAGFIVGVVEKDQLIDGRQVRAGDQLIGLASSGPHANGYALIRTIYQRSNPPVDLQLDPGHTLLDALLAPTTLYVKPILSLLHAHRSAIHAMAHITGGGILDNIIRVIPPTLSLHIDSQAWPLPPVFAWLQREGGIQQTDLWRTFNCGIGYVLVVDVKQTDTVLATLQTQGITHWHVGEVTQTNNLANRVIVT